VAVLEEGHAGTWRVDATDGLHWDKFQLTYQPTVSGRFDIRIALRTGGTDVATTRIHEISVASPVPCGTTPSPPSPLPSSDGWVTGEVFVGGAVPVLKPQDACDRETFTVAVYDAAGIWVENKVVPGGEYVLLLPAGSYALNTSTTEPTGECHSTAVTVVAGQQSVADIGCVTTDA
jgi:hypothetical protein